MATKPFGKVIFIISITLFYLNNCEGLSLFGYGVGECSQKVPIIKDFDISRVLILHNNIIFY
jgi:hypothetical protein